MADNIREQLPALMGEETLGIQYNLKYPDDAVCRNFLCGLCPNDLFLNTKALIGACPKKHPSMLKVEYEEAKQSGQERGYEREWYINLRQFVEDCDRKVNYVQKRLDETPDEPRVVELRSKIKEVQEEIAVLTETIEKCREAGDIEESIRAAQLSETKTDDMNVLEKELKENAKRNANSQQQWLRVCEICGAYLSEGENDRRLAEHFGGKVSSGGVYV
ncbi:putative U1 snRNP protein [Cladochytrium replicatum]|nr:putative U1 snRNP protein [Cladochytrium replicatum]